MHAPPGGGADDGALDVAPPPPAAALDARLARLARREARCRLALGRLAAEVCDGQAHHGLGFARLGDYTRERLGLSAREVQSLAAVARASAGLPRLTAAFRTGGLAWTTLRLLCEVARPEDEERWLAEARGRPTRLLRARIHEILDPIAARPAPDFDPDADDAIEGETPVRVRIACPRRVRRRWHHAVELARRMMGEQAPVWRAAEAIAAEALAGPPRRSCEVAGCAAPLWEAPACPDGFSAAAPMRRNVAQIPDAGTAMLGDPRANAVSSADGLDAPGSTADGTRALDSSAFAASTPGSAADGAGAPQAPAPRTTTSPRPWRPPVGPATLDERMQRVLVVLRRLDAEIGRVLALAVAERVPRALGFPSLAAYARARLGISAGKARTLLALDRRARRVPAFAAAYAAGTLSWTRALALLPVVTPATADAWVARARAITLRALEGEVEETLDRWDAAPAGGMPPPRPPEAPAGVGGTRWEAGTAEAERRGPDGETAIDALEGLSQRGRGSTVPDHGDHPGAPHRDISRGRQMGARSTGRRGTPAASPNRGVFLSDVEIAFVAPRSVAVLLHEAIAAFTRRRECRWWALSRILGHVICEWERPARDPRRPRPRERHGARRGRVGARRGSRGSRLAPFHRRALPALSLASSERSRWPARSGRPEEECDETDDANCPGVWCAGGL